MNFALGLSEHIYELFSNNDGAYVIIFSDVVLLQTCPVIIMKKFESLLTLHGVVLLVLEQEDIAESANTHLKTLCLS